MPAGWGHHVRIWSSTEGRHEAGRFPSALASSLMHLDHTCGQLGVEKGQLDSLCRSLPGWVVRTGTSRGLKRLIVCPSITSPASSMLPARIRMVSPEFQGVSDYQNDQASVFGAARGPGGSERTIRPARCPPPARVASRILIHPRREAAGSEGKASFSWYFTSYP